MAMQIVNIPFRLLRSLLGMEVRVTIVRTGTAFILVTLAT